MITCLAVVWAAAGFVLGANENSAADEAYFVQSNCQQDATGRIWGLPRKEQSAESLAYWQDGAWKPIDYLPVPSSEDSASPGYLQRLPNGEVMVRWYLDKARQFVLTAHEGDKARIVARIPNPDKGIGAMLVDAKGETWATQQRGLFRIPSGEPLAEFPKKAVTYFSMLQYHESPYPVDVVEANYRPPDLFMDPSSRVWVWVPALPQYAWEPGMRGCFIVEADTPVHHPTFEGIPDAPYSVFTPKSGDTYWLAVVGHGLFDFDTKSLRGTPVNEPEPRVFRNIFQITAVKNDWYVLASQETAMEDWAVKPASLWRLRNGAWQRVLTGLDQAPHSLAETKDGLWVGSVNDGLWFIPNAGGEPVQLNWHRGCDMGSVHELYSISDQSVLAIMSRARWTWKHAARELQWADIAKAPRVATNVKEVRFICMPERDEAGVLWGVRLEVPRVLGAWDGTGWIDYPMPAEVAPFSLASVTPDDKGRIWVWQWKEFKGFRHDLASGPVFILDKKTHEWTNYESFTKALVEERARRGEFTFLAMNAIHPQFGPDKQVAFNFSSHGQLHLFDGQTWHVYERDFMRKFDKHDPRVRHMSFDETGRFCVSVYAQDYNTGQDQQFLLARNADDTWTRVDSPLPQPQPASADALRMRPDYPTNQDGRFQYVVNVDARDILWYWYMKDGQLVRGGLGAETPQFPADETNPFRSVENIWRVDIDLAGNAWFALDTGHDACIITPHEPAVDTKADVTKEAVDSVRIVMAAPNVAEPRFVWRFDGGAWSMPQKDAEVRLATLSGGEHTFEAFAIDQYLTPDSTSAIAKFTIDIDTGQQIAGWIEQLSSPDYDVRGAAVKALQQQPEEALKALREARPIASESAQWWIDVAIQQIERKQKAPVSEVPAR